MIKIIVEILAVVILIEACVALGFMLYAIIRDLGVRK